MKKEDLPQYIPEGYKSSLLSATITPNEGSLVLRKDTLSDVPGAWLYHGYTLRRVEILRILHLLGLSIELFCYFFSQIWIKFIHSHNSSPFSADPIFISAGWGFICFLGIILIPVIFSDSHFSVSLLTEKLVWLYYPNYLLLGLLFLSGEFQDGDSVYISGIIILTLIFLLSVWIYFKIKQINQKIKVSWTEYFAGSALVSVVSSFSLLELMRMIIELIFQKNGGDFSDFLGWQGENWLIFLLTLVFGVGAVMLTMHKDPWFPCAIAYYYFGLYVNQITYTCKYHRPACNGKIKIAEVTLASILISFTLIILIFKKKYKYNNVI